MSETTMESPRTPPVLSRRCLAAILLTTCLSSFATPYISSGVQLALPVITAEYGVSATLIGWVPTAFLLPYAIFLLPFGKIADTWGRRRIFLGGTATMTGGILIAGMAPGFWFILLGMAIAGFGSAMTFATSVPLLTTNYPLRERGKVIGINTAVVYIGLSSGPFVGGILTDAFGWRALYLVAVPVALAALAAGALFVPRDPGLKHEQGLGFDAAGTAIYAGGLILLIIGASRLPELWAAVLVVTGTAGMTGFLAWEGRCANPIFPIRTFVGNRPFTYSNIAALINYSSTYAITFLLSMYLYYIQGFPPAVAGTVLVAQPVMMAITTPLAGRLSDRIEPRLLATAGMTIVAAGLFALAFVGWDTPMAAVVGILLFLGFGYGVFSSPNMNSIMSSVADSRAGIASATAGTMRVLGQIASMAIAMTAFSVIIGTVVISQEVADELLRAISASFVVFGCLCTVGIWFSYARGNLRSNE
jgi:MFS family permease